MDILVREGKNDVGSGDPRDIGRLFQPRISIHCQEAFSTILPLIIHGKILSASPILAGPESEYYRVFTVRVIQFKIES